MGELSLVGCIDNLVVGISLVGIIAEPAHSVYDIKVLLVKMFDERGNELWGTYTNWRSLSMRLEGAKIATESIFICCVPCGPLLSSHEVYF